MSIKKTILIPLIGLAISSSLFATEGEAPASAKSEVRGPIGYTPVFNIKRAIFGEYHFKKDGYLKVLKKGEQTPDSDAEPITVEITSKMLPSYYKPKTKNYRIKNLDIEITHNDKKLEFHRTLYLDQGANLMRDVLNGKQECDLSSKRIEIPSVVTVGYEAGPWEYTCSDGSTLKLIVEVEPSSKPAFANVVLTTSRTSGEYARESVVTYNINGGGDIKDIAFISIDNDKIIAIKEK